MCSDCSTDFHQPNVMSNEVLSFFPQEISYTDVRTNQTYIQTVEITNTTQTSLSLRIRPGNVERLSADPSTLTLGISRCPDRYHYHQSFCPKFPLFQTLSHTKINWKIAGPGEARKVHCKLKIIKPLPKKKSGPWVLTHPSPWTCSVCLQCLNHGM